MADTPDRCESKPPAVSAARGHLLADQPTRPRWHLNGYPFTSKPIVEVAKAYGVGPESLRRWLVKYREAHGGTEEELSLPERARLKELERENQELKAEMAFLNYVDVRVIPMFG